MRAEELSSSSDWKETAAAMRDLMTEWKAAGRASRDVEDALWARFRAAQDAFFARRSERVRRARRRAGDQPAAQGSDHRRGRAIDVSDPKAAQATLRDLQARFDDDRSRPARRDAPTRRAGCALPNSGSATPSTPSGGGQCRVQSVPRRSCGTGWPRPRRSWSGPAKSGDAARIAKAEAEVAAGGR